ncbi:MAG TPA: ferrochelatase, partial [Candidatus Limnocylindrales bacterium]|nr:ferrochelatase [Candidatus Limnocylindrales bacterium]
GETWLGPDVLDALRDLQAKGGRDVVVCPIGFVAEHLEVLYDIDIEAQAVARDVGMRLERVRSMNDDERFIGALADIAAAGLDGAENPMATRAE